MDVLGDPVSRVTIADVAVAAGVSKTAVSFAFNNPEKLGSSDRSSGSCRWPHDLGYAPHPAARALSMRRSGTIGVLIPQRLCTVFANPFLSELIQGLGELCEEHDLTLLLVPPLDGSLEGAIRQASVDGFISLGLSPDDRALETLGRLGIPTVLVDSDGSPDHPAVNVDDEGGAAQAAEHLARSRPPDLFAIIVLPPTRAQARLTPTAARRLAGYRAALDRRRRAAAHLVTAGVDHGRGRARLRRAPARQAPSHRRPRHERHGRDRRDVGGSRGRPRRAARPLGRRL